MPYIITYIIIASIFLTIFCAVAGKASRDEEREWMLNDLVNGNK